MAEFSFSILEAFEKQFGYKPPDFNFTNFAVLGSPNTATDIFGREYYMPVKLGGLSFPYCTTRISCKKTIVKTGLVNRPGSVKELISFEDYEIELRGLIVAQYDTLPTSQIKQVRDFFKQQTSLSISSALIDIFLAQPETNGSNHVIIESYEFPEVRGVMNVRPFTMRLVSDAPFELIKTTNS